MKKSDFKQFIREEIKHTLSEEQPLFPKGGSIGGPHKQPIKDKDFSGTGTLDSRGDQNKNAGEKQKNYIEGYMKIADRYLGIPWNPLGNPNVISLDYLLHNIKRSIENWKSRRNNFTPDNYKLELESFKYNLNKLPRGFSKHFGIDPDSDESIISFLDYGTDSFLGNYEEFMKAISKYNRNDLSESKQLQTSPEAIKEMRDWAKDCQWGDITEEDIDEMSDEEIVKGIKRNFSGGLKGFLQSIGETTVDEITVVDQTTDDSEVNDIASAENKSPDTVQAAINQAKISNKPVTIS